MMRTEEGTPSSIDDALRGILDMGLDPETLARLQERIHNSTRKVKKKGRSRKKLAPPPKGMQTHALVMDVISLKNIPDVNFNVCLKSVSM